jgi:hypothetical protein
MSFLDIIWFIFVSFLFVGYLMVLFRIIGDLFSDPEHSGFSKALWMIALIIVPFVSAFIYLMVRGGGMADRSADAARSVQADQEAYIRSVSGPASSSEQITQAKQLLDSGAIDASEYATLKAEALKQPAVA